MCKLNKFHGKVNINSLSIETALNFDDLIHRRTGRVGEGGLQPPQILGNSDFLGKSRENLGKASF